MELLKETILNRFNHPLNTTKDYELLSESIKEKTDKHVSVATLKRFFGRAQKHHHYPDTLDILCEYAGFNSFEVYKKNYIEEESYFFNNYIYTKDLKEGQFLTIEYAPDRKIRLLANGQNTFTVVESQNSKLQVNDIVKFSVVTKDHPLIIEEVYRGDENIGGFIAGKEAGIKKYKVTDKNGQQVF